MKLRRYYVGKKADNILKIAQNHFKKDGVFCVLGHTGVSKFEKYFKPLEMGIYTLDEESKSYADYFIGRKK